MRLTNCTKNGLRPALLLFLLIFDLQSLRSQTFDWEISLDQNDKRGAFNEIDIDENGTIYGVAWYNSSNCFRENSLEYVKVDSSGNLIKRIVLFDSVYLWTFHGGILRIPNEEAHMVYGTGRSSCNGNNIAFIAKVDTSGSILWNYDTSYTFLYDYTCYSAIVLEDKSTVTVGNNGYAITEFDIVARRIDSVGNLIWEKNYPFLQWQGALKIIDAYDGSYLILGNSGNDVALLRINKRGDLLNHLFVQTNIGGVSGGNINILPNKRILVNVDRFDGNWTRTNFFTLDTLLNVIQDTIFSDWLYSPTILSDTTIQVERFPHPDSMYFSNIDQNFAVSSEILLSVGNPRKAPFTHYHNNNSVVIAGGLVNSNIDFDLWMSKYDGVPKIWKPNKCSFNPPHAMFSFDYTYPILTVYDSSYSGLVYDDSIYSLQWTTSLGQGTDDSLLILLDTAVNKTVDVELVISNWYGCTDTVNTTLDFTSTGIKAYHELEAKVFPNPSKDILNVHLNITSDHPIFTLYDLQGRAVRMQKLTNEQSVISLEKVSQGLYFYEITNGKKVVRGKVVKE